MESRPRPPTASRTAERSWYLMSHAWSQDQLRTLHALGIEAGFKPLLSSRKSANSVLAPYPPLETVSCGFMQSESDYVVLTEEPSLMRAHWVAGALEAEGIRTFVDEDNLADEFAISQKVLGLLRVRVLVPRDRLLEAQTIFLNLSQPIPLVDEDEDDEEDPEDERTQITPGLAMLIVVGIVVLVGGLALVARGCEDEPRFNDPFEVPPEPTRRPSGNPLHK